MAKETASKSTADTIEKTPFDCEERRKELDKLCNTEGPNVA
jgi:hypothetical protein